VFRRVSSGRRLRRNVSAVNPANSRWGCLAGFCRVVRCGRRKDCCSSSNGQADFNRQLGYSHIRRIGPRSVTVRRTGIQAGSSPVSEPPCTTDDRRIADLCRAEALWDRLKFQRGLHVVNSLPESASAPTGRRTLTDVFTSRAARPIVRFYGSRSHPYGRRRQ
jgi:hypothetical protein